MKKILILAVLVIFFNSCSDSRSEGCTDPYAIPGSYDPNADYDDGSCIYQVDVVFALDGNASAYLNADDNATEVAYYIDNLLIGKDYWDTEYGFPFAIPGVNPPLCYESGYTSFTMEWSGSNNTTFYYEAIPNGGIFEWVDNVMIHKADQCIYVPLTLAKKSEKVKSSSLEDKEKNIITKFK